MLDVVVGLQPELALFAVEFLNREGAAEDVVLPVDFHVLLFATLHVTLPVGCG